ncbi:3-methyladenine DNA glycosylase [Luteimicrobium sp. DT211]|uniref:3-methyladenine DNA glycosylase n=1 Tax=Luteimicrobium sp. DT211 TaxID=3393412 RepID=UPI003CEAAB67
MSPSAATATSARALPSARWAALEVAHADRADALTAGWRERRAAGTTHAIEDFLFTYYPTRPAQLRRWHPGAGVVLATPAVDADPAVRASFSERADWRWYRTEPDGVTLDTGAYLTDRGDTVRYVRELLAATASRPARFGCLGLHEWAMVYRDHAAGRARRHALPLRLGGDGTDAVVEGHRIRCTHFDAYRFFTPEASGLNSEHPTRETQPALEQPGCLHANMDLYKWALKLGPAVPGELLLDTFELARDVRVLDMQASPYDVSPYGLAPVAIETPDGRAEYVRRQQECAERSAALRSRVLDVCENLLDGTPAHL